MTGRVTGWGGVDVGGDKGFDVAMIDDHRLIGGPSRKVSLVDLVAWLCERKPSVVAVDSPRTPAADGALSRPEERELAKSVCSIRYTPNEAILNVGSGYYALATLDLAGLPSRMNQDARDAVGAAITARLHSGGESACFGAIVVPRASRLDATQHGRRTG
jgi:predicted nuclease with RNAse H fold